MIRELHIVCLDVPWPPDYGGAIDMMNRIKAFKKAGINIHLHYFSYNRRGTPGELKPYCESIHVYRRKKGLKGLSFRLPYIVASRINKELIDNLNKDELPILLEGLHCTGILPYIDYKRRKVVVRMHNEESLYYQELARAEKSWFRKLFFKRESRLIKSYNNRLPSECTYACVSEEDVAILKNRWKLINAVFIPTFPAWQQVTVSAGTGKFCLYHGNLSVAENEEAAVWLLEKVCPKIEIPFYIAGKNPSPRIEKLARSLKYVVIVANPSADEMDGLVREAHICVLPSFNCTITGIRLKLLHSLFEGRHCIVSEAMVKGTGLGKSCHIAKDEVEFISLIKTLFGLSFTEDDIQLRKELLGDTYNNDKNTNLFSQYLW